MRLPELAILLSDIPGFYGKVAYRAFAEAAAPDLPYITYLETGSDNMAADNSVFHKQTEVDIELYTLTKSPDTEELVEAALNSAELYWEKTEDYLESEACYMIVYSITI